MSKLVEMLIDQVHRHTSDLNADVSDLELRAAVLRISEIQELLRKLGGTGAKERVPGTHFHFLVAGFEENQH